jgi:cytochrome c5
MPPAMALFAQGPDLPAGSGAEIVRVKCLTCHGTDLIRQQRLTRGAWQREVDKMVRWGASMDERERGVVIDYLSAHWPSRAVSNGSPAPVAGPGAETFRRQCLGCHDTDIIEQQRLGRAGWVREVDKMIRWGASVSETEKQALVDYLAARFSEAN